MFAPILLILINALVILSINAGYSYKTASYINSFKVPSELTENLVDDNVMNTIDFMCQDNITECYSQLKITKKMTYSKNDLNKNITDNINLSNELIDISFNELSIDMDSKKIKITHVINDIEKRKKYINYYLNKNYEFYCVDGTVLPCVGSAIEKKRDLSYKLEVILLEKEENDLIDELSLLNITSDKYKEISAKIVELKEKKIKVSNRNKKNK